MICQRCNINILVTCAGCQQSHCPDCEQNHDRNCPGGIASFVAPTSKRKFNETDIYGDLNEEVKRRKVISASPFYPTEGSGQNTSFSHFDESESSMEQDRPGDAGEIFFPSGSTPVSFNPPQNNSPLAISSDSASGFQGITSSSGTQNFSSNTPQMRHNANTLMQSSAPALGIVTWNMQRLGMLRSKVELDAQPKAINIIYEKNKKFLLQILEEISALVQNTPEHDQILAELNRFDNASSPQDISIFEETTITDEEAALCLLLIEQEVVKGEKWNLVRRFADQVFLNELKGEIQKFTSDSDFKLNHRRSSEKDRGALYLHLKKYIYISTKAQSKERETLLGQLSLYRRLLKLEHIVEMFKENAWLDVLIMQEVGLGFELLKNLTTEYASSLGINLKCYSGPLTMSAGGYKEYFAIIVRQEVVVEKCGWSDTGGKIKEFEIDAGCEETYKYDRSEEGYRPIIFYKLKPPPPRNTHSIYVGAVHTTPEGTEFRRAEDYKQINESSLKLREHARGQWVIIGGDYYLTAEALIKKISDEEEEKFIKQSYEMVRLLEHHKAGMSRMLELAREIAGKGAEHGEYLRVKLEQYWRERQNVNRAATCLRHLIDRKVNDTGQALSLLENLLTLAPDSMSSDMIKSALKEEDNIKALAQLIESDMKISFNYVALLEWRLEEINKSIPEQIYAARQIPLPVVRVIKSLEKTVVRMREISSDILKKARNKIVIKDSQFQEINRNSANLTFAAAVKAGNWTLCQAVTATNWKEPPTSGSAEEWKRGRIADFYICTQDWVNAQIGLIIPPFISSGVVLADSSELLMSRHWIAISDHIPIAGYFTGSQEDHKFLGEIAKIPTEEKFLAQARWRGAGYFKELKLEAADYSTYDFSS